jgi:Outer membrane protein beta-barrel domain
VHRHVAGRCALRVLNWQRAGLISILAGYVLLFSGTCAGQEPRPAAVGPTVSVSLGYLYVSTEVTTVGRFGENGVLASINVDFNPRFGIKGEVGYTRTFGAFGISRHSDMLTLLAGPVAYPVRRRKFSIYAQGLAGAARIEGVLPQGGGAYLLSEAIKPAFGVGAGVEISLSRSLGVSVGADYLRVSNLTPQLLLRGQWDPRASVSLVYTFGNRR